MVLPVERAVATLEAVVLTVPVVEGLIAAEVGLVVVDLNVVETGREVEGAVAGLETEM